VLIDGHLLFARSEAKLRAHHGNTLQGKNGVHAFGYNCAESEPIWMKSGALWANCWGLALKDFGCDARSSDSLREPKFFCQVNNARFHRLPIGQILRHLNTTTSIGQAVKTFGKEFWNLYHKGSFFQKAAKMSHKISKSWNFRPP